jgi:hypothetical protein
LGKSITNAIFKATATFFQVFWTDFVNRQFGGTNLHFARDMMLHAGKMVGLKKLSDESVSVLGRISTGAYDDREELGSDPRILYKQRQFNDRYQFSDRRYDAEYGTTDRNKAALVNRAFYTPSVTPPPRGEAAKYADTRLDLVAKIKDDGAVSQFGYNPDSPEETFSRAWISGMAEAILPLQLTNPSGDKVDGYHRWRTSERALRTVPHVEFEDYGRTIRIRYNAEKEWGMGPVALWGDQSSYRTSATRVRRGNVSYGDVEFDAPEGASY